MKPSRAGEYVTFGLSLAIVGGLLIYFIFSSFKHDPEERLSFESRVVWEEVSAFNGRTIVPIVIKNLGSKTADLVKVKIETPEFDTEAELEYLTRNGSRKIFIMLPGRPEKDAIKITPIFYSLE